MKKKNGKIELLRFVFAMCVLGIHVLVYAFGEDNIPAGKLIVPFHFGYLGVEFFFILSGVLMARSIERDNSGLSLGKSTLSFMKRKISPLLFLHFLIFIVYFAVNTLYLKQYSKIDTVKSLLNSVPGLFFLERSGMGGSYLNGIEWYLSSMLLAMFVLYPLNKKLKSTFTHIIAPLIVIFLYGWLMHETGSINGTTAWTGVTYKCNIRALAGVSLGTVCYEFIKKLSAHEFTKKGRAWLTVVEIGAWLCALGLMCVNAAKDYQMVIVAFIALGMVISFAHVTCGADKFDNAFFGYLGKLTLPIFLCQFMMIFVVQKMFEGKSFMVRLALIVGTVIVFSIILERINTAFYKKINNGKKALAKKG